MKHGRGGSLISELDASKRGEVLLRLVERIFQLPPTPKKVLALYYYENLQPAEIAACLGLAEQDIDLILAQTVRLLETKVFRDLEQSSRLNSIPLSTSGPQLPYPWLQG
jgi:DNA-directed RNA polymerase specialized sigma24 family protein